MMPPVENVDLEITALAAGGDGVGRDERGRVTFVPRTAVGDRVRVRIGKSTSSFARGEIIELVTPSADRVTPPCEYFLAGCGGCAWQHIARSAQLSAKQAIVEGALRRLDGLAIEPIADPSAPYGWRRRARFHVDRGKVGLYALGTEQVIPTARCPQLEPALEAALRLVAVASPPDGELMLVLGHQGHVGVSLEHHWRGAAGLLGRTGIVGVQAGKDTHGKPLIEIEPGLFGTARDFAQASAAGNAMLIELARSALGKGPGRLVELYAGGGNLTRAFAADGWMVSASDVAAPPKSPATATTFSVGRADQALAKTIGDVNAIVLDPPRTGAAEAIDGIVSLAPATVVYVSCDPATLARDVNRLVAAGYKAERAWPIDLMPQTAHVEIVMRLVRVTQAARQEP